ncbi:MAG: hypothetical protein ACI85I_000914 [Arenicella sp.]|jgi:hypothetical protein
MKKKIIIGVVVAVIALIGYSAVSFFVVPTESIRSIYLIPKDAIYVIELKDAIGSWKKISSHPMWSHLRTNAYFAELTESANSLDEAIKDNSTLFDLVGERTIMCSAHMYKRNDYDFLFAVDLKRQSKLPIQPIIENFVQGGFKVTKREYHGQEIIELYDTESRETLNIAFVKNNFVGSYQAKLLEASIDQLEEPVIGRDVHFQEVMKSVDTNGMFRVYLQYAYLDDYMKAYMDEENEYVKSLSEQLFFTGLDCDLGEDGVIRMKGFTNINDTLDSYLLAMLKSGKGSMDIAKIAPQRTAFYMGLGFNSFSDFMENFEDLMKETNEDWEEYQANIEKVEKYLKIDLKENFYGWVDDELAFIQTQPGKLGKDNEFALVMKAKSGEEASENLKYISDQIRKKTPVKFKEVTYKGHTINFLSVKGFFKMMLGSMFSKLEKPYFTVIDDYVVFSNHPQTIKSIIDDYEAEKTLANLEDFKKFKSEFKDKSNVFVYMQMPVLHDNLKGFVSAETWKDLQKNKDYVVCFSHVGFQLTKDGDMFATRMASLYQDKRMIAEQLKQISFEKGQKANGLFGDVFIKNTLGEDSLVKGMTTEDLAEEIEEEEMMVVAEISPNDLDADEYVEKYPNGQVKFVVKLDDGIKNGTYIEYHENGEIKYKGKFDNDQRDGTWKEYDENGKRIRKIKYKDGVLQ